MVPLGGVGGGLWEPRGGGNGGGLSEPGEYWRPDSADWRPPSEAAEEYCRPPSEAAEENWRPPSELTEEVMDEWMERGGRAGALPGLSHLKKEKY